MNISASSLLPSAIGATVQWADNPPAKMRWVKADRQTGVQAALTDRSSRPSPLQSRQAGIQSIVHLSQQLGIDLPGRAILLRPAMPAPNR